MLSMYEGVHIELSPFIYNSNNNKLDSKRNLPLLSKAMQTIPHRNKQFFVHMYAAIPLTNRMPKNK